MSTMLLFLWFVGVFLVALLPARIANWIWCGVAAVLFVRDGSGLALLMSMWMARDAVASTPHRDNR